MTMTTLTQPAASNHAVLNLPKADLSENARIVLAKRYLKKDDQGNPVESPEEMFWRVATVIAAEESKFGASEAEVDAMAREFYSLMTKRLFEPNSPTLMNAGRPLGQLSACFVLPVEDTLSNGKNGIYDTLRSMALVHQSGGGTGFSFSRIRPANDRVKSTTGVSSGPVSFMKLYDASTEVVKQGGTRRGANMGVLRVDHPDILEFIDCKQDTSQVTNFNISVAVTDRFMEAVEQGGSYNLVSPRTGAVVGQLDAREVWGKVVANAWRTGEPGVLFIDRANAYNPVPHLGAYEGTNPCGEQWLLPYDVCNLGSVNVGMFVREDVESDAPWHEKIDWKEYRRVVRLATRFLDNVIDANQFPLPEVHDLAHRIRRIGLGVMGFADLLVRLGIGYNSEEGVEVGRQIFAFLDEESKKESERLAEVRGVFPEWELSIWGPDATCARAADGSRVRPMRRLRNANVNTVAPTGTISIFAGCSSGVEPLFAVAFMRNQAGARMADVNEDFVRVAKARGFYSEALMERIAESGHIHHEEVPEDVQRAFVTAHDIAPEWHVKMQAAFQESCDSSISKTVNFPHEATEAEVREIYEMAFRLGCKGVTVYRDGSRGDAPLTTGKTGQAAAPAPEVSAEMERLSERAAALEAEVAVLKAGRVKRKRPAVLKGTTRQVESPLGELFVTINEDPKDHAFELFATLGKAGSIAMADAEAIGRLISLGLRFGIPLEEVYKQLRGISSDKAVGFGQNQVLSVPDAIAQAIGQHLKEKAGVQEELPLAAEEAAEAAAVALPAAPDLLDLPGSRDHLMESCPDCKVPGNFIRESGCMKCMTPGCGFSKCS